jgi:dTDP-4-dehydrorhamnose reductase
LAEADSVKEVVKKHRPDWVVHCAALTDVDYCEAHPDEAQWTNVFASRNVAEAVRDAGSRMVYISTDSVFDGARGRYSETDRPHPINAYSASKLQGEKAVRGVLPDVTIVRTSIYGWNSLKKESIAEWMLRHFERGETFRGFVDITFSPILVNDLIDVLEKVMERNLKGVYHVSASDSCTKYSFSQHVATAFGFPTELVKPSSYIEAGLAAPRPLNTSLNTFKIEKSLGIAMPKVWQGLLRFKALRESAYLGRLRQMSK